MQFDVSKYEPGVALAANMIVVECPRCHKGAIRKQTKLRIHFVHEYTIERRKYEGRGDRNHAAKANECVYTTAEALAAGIKV